MTLGSKAMGRAAALGVAAALACSRTGLDEESRDILHGPDAPFASSGGAGQGGGDAAPDARAGGAGTGTSGAGGVSADSGIDARDSGADARDSSVDAAPFDCVDAGITYIYLVDSDDVLWSYYPPSGDFTAIGTISCPAPAGTSPFSMGVDRHGVAYVLFSDGQIYRVDTKTAACAGTSFVPGQQGFLTFGMGFAADAVGGEALYVVQRTFVPDPPPSKGLGIIDTKTFELSFVGPFSPSPKAAGMELTGTGAGGLFAYGLETPGPGGRVLEIDRTNAKILSDVPLPVGMASSALAFAFWGGRFYIFTTTPKHDGTNVTSYDPNSGAVELVLTKNGSIVVGAGVSTCAPG